LTPQTHLYSRQGHGHEALPPDSRGLAEVQKINPIPPGLQDPVQVAVAISLLNEQLRLVEAVPQMKKPPQFILADPDLEVGRGLFAFTGAVAHGASLSPSFPGFPNHFPAPEPPSLMHLPPAEPVD
jgi:hypothetical protein